MATSNATATWEGKLKEGKGTFKAQSGVFSGAFSFGASAMLSSSLNVMMVALIFKVVSYANIRIEYYRL